MRRFLDRILPEPLLRLRNAYWMSKRLHRFIDTAAATYNNDGLVTFNDSDFLRDPHFLESYQLGKATGSWSQQDIQWRAYIACWAAEKGKSLEGDYVECGVNRGGLSRTVMQYIDFATMPHKKFYLLDTYCGFPEEHRKNAAHWNQDEYSECYDDVVKTFAPFPNAIVVRGKVPDTLSQVPSQRICYLSIDMNVMEPEIAAAEFFWDKLSSGAVMLLDDYGFGEAYRRQKDAFNVFAKERGVAVLLLPTGQGLIIKP
jgi:O-methyltransferase